MAVTVRIITRRVIMRPLPSLARGGGRRSLLTAFDRASTDVYVSAVYAWKTPTTPSNAEIVDGLLATVARYPHLAGRLGVDDRGRKFFHLNDAGVLILEAEADGDRADSLAHDVSTHVNELYPKADQERADEPLFQAQLTRYRCGGLVIGTACRHLVADGHSMSFFYTAWATAVRTNSGTLPSPVNDRTTITVPRSPPSLLFDHRNIEFRGEHSPRHSYRTLPMARIKNLAIHFSEEFVAGLKYRVSGRCSTFECLLAHAWKKVTEARCLAPDELTQIRVAVNCRTRAKPPVPMEYFGNMVLWAFPRMRAGELLSSSYALVIGVIRDAVARIDADYIQSFVDFGEMAGHAGEEHPSTAATPGMSFSPDLEVDSWLGFRFHGLDFGHGPPCRFLPPNIPIEGMLVFVPTCSAKGGVDLFMTLDDEHVHAFKQICHSMDRPRASI